MSVRTCAGRAERILLPASCNFQSVVGRRFEFSLSLNGQLRRDKNVSEGLISKGLDAGGNSTRGWRGVGLLLSPRVDPQMASGECLTPVSEQGNGVPHWQ